MPTFNYLGKFRPRLTQRYPNLIGAASYMFAGFTSLATICDGAEEEIAKCVEPSYHIEDKFKNVGGIGKTKKTHGKEQMSESDDDFALAQLAQMYQQDTPELRLEKYIINAPWCHSMHTSYSGTIELTERFVVLYEYCCNIATILHQYYDG